MECKLYMRKTLQKETKRDSLQNEYCL